MYYIFFRIRRYTKIAHVMNYVYIYLIDVMYNIIIQNSLTFNVFAHYVTFRKIRDMSN